MVDRIRDIVNTLNPEGEPVWDLFAGSGTVASALAADRDVVASDIQEYSRVLCSALLCSSTLSDYHVEQLLTAVHGGEHASQLYSIAEPLLTYEALCLERATAGDPEPLCELLDHGSIIGFEEGACGAASELRKALQSVRKGIHRTGIDPRLLLVFRYYGGMYFSFRQALEMDALLEAISNVAPSSRDTFMAALLSTASEVVNTVGKQFAQPLRPRSRNGAPKEHLVRKIVRDRAADVQGIYKSWIQRYRTLSSASRSHVVRRGDYSDLLQTFQGRMGIIYADPPYTRDHYSRYYHVLETLCLRDSPRVSTTQIGGERRMSRGIYRYERHQSPFCIKRQAPGAFSKLFSGARRFEVPLVLSYSPYEQARGARPRLMTVDGITSLAREYYRRVEVISAGEIAHNKLNVTRLNVGISYDAEVLVLCEP